MHTKPTSRKRRSALALIGAAALIIGLSAGTSTGSASAGGRYSTSDPTDGGGAETASIRSGIRW